MKTPISYYGGKQYIVNEIASRIYQPHTLYCEPFFGGGAVFFAKDKERYEVINDKNDNVVNFYRCVKDPVSFKKLITMADGSLYSQSLYKRAQAIWRRQIEVDDVMLAWAFWYMSGTSYEHIIGAAFRTSRGSGDCTSKLFNSKRLLRDIAGRFEHVQIMCMDAVECIRKFDSEGSLFYVDPPYVGADQGHYTGYKQENFDALLDCLASVRGHFILSSYENDALVKKAATLGWHTQSVSSYTTYRSGGVMQRANRTELLTANYSMDKMGSTLW